MPPIVLTILENSISQENPETHLVAFRPKAETTESHSQSSSHHDGFLLFATHLPPNLLVKSVSHIYKLGDNFLVEFRISRHRNNFSILIHSLHQALWARV
jgi:hypothetical protein